jgi:hypothetical protein
VRDKSVYAATSGFYSDYRVHALFETKELAEEVANIDNAGKGGWGDMSVEGFVLYDAVPQRRVKHTLTVADRKDHWSGESIPLEGGWFVGEVERLLWPWDFDIPKNCRAKVNRHGLKMKKGWRTFSVEGWDKDACKKAVYDTLTQIKAEDEGIA